MVINRAPPYKQPLAVTNIITELQGTNLNTMQNLVYLLLLVSSLTCPAQAILPIGASLPKGDIKMKDISGTLVSMNEVKTANGLLVMFSCNTCPYVIRNQERTKEICRYAESKHIGVIILNSNDGGRQDGESFSDMEAYAKQQGYIWKYALDSRNEVADAFGASRTPECYLFNGAEKLVYHGAIDNSPADAGSVSRVHIKEALNEMTEGKDVSVRETRSVGCSIRRRS